MQFGGTWTYILYLLFHYLPRNNVFGTLIKPVKWTRFYYDRKSDTSPLRWE